MLVNYGMPEDGSDFASNDADANLVPELIEKVALPILHHEIAHCWDMLSTRETRNAALATSLITDYVSTSSEALTELLVVIRTRLSSAVEDLTVSIFFCTYQCYCCLYYHLFRELTFLGLIESIYYTLNCLLCSHDVFIFNPQWIISKRIC